MPPKSDTSTSSSGSNAKNCHSACVCKCEEALTGSRSFSVKAKVKKQKIPKMQDKERKAGAARDRKLPRFEVSGKVAARTAKVEWKFFKSNSCAMKERLVLAKGWRKLLRFTTQIANTGTADFVLGDPSQSDLFEYSECHDHFHLKGYALYELLDDQGREVARGRKMGFCLLDSISVGSDKAPRYDCSNQGLTKLYADVYNYRLDGQWVDITEVEAGDYTLRITVDPDSIFDSLPSSKKVAEVAVTIPPD